MIKRCKLYQVLQASICVLLDFPDIFSFALSLSHYLKCTTTPQFALSFSLFLFFSHSHRLICSLSLSLSFSISLYLSLSLSLSLFIYINIYIYIYIYLYLFYIYIYIYIYIYPLKIISPFKDAKFRIYTSFFVVWIPNTSEMMR